MAYTTIKKPSDYFNTNLYTANGSGKTISGMDFQPDFVWTKNRDNASYIPALVDAVRGGTKKLFSNNTDAEATDANAITAFNSDGYTFGSSGSFNFGTDDYVNWCWKANGAGSANTDGSISSTVSANTTSGFSVGTFSGNATTGATVGHGLGVAPSMFIVKKTSGAGDWYCYHSGIGATKFIKLNDTAASATNALWNNTAPTSSVFSMDSNSAVNGSGESYVFYAFANIQGFSKFGSYVGNGSTDGTFVYTGFKPAFVMHKRIDSTSEWFMFDNKRLGYNSENYRLMANLSNAEADAGEYDLLSNGFKIGITSGNVNGSGASYIYMAFAEQPLVGDNPCTAR